ncbi:MAG: 2-hydroxyacyl-CoA dehydratase [Desulfobacterales bacterium]|nr:2-hydroxyacyl-CoA dehydratase [Desulfobacterales bacterium]
MKKNILNEISQLKKNGHKIIGCFPLYPPVELLNSMELTPILFWGLRDSITDLEKSNQHIQNFACSVSRHMTQFILSEAGTYLDGLFMYNSCDTLRNLPEIITIGLEKNNIFIPFFKIHIPMSLPHTHYTKNYLKAEIHKLIDQLSERFNVSFSPDKFIKSIESYRLRNILCERLEYAVALGILSFNIYAKTLLNLLVMTIETQINHLDSILNSCKFENNQETCLSKKRILLSGILPPPQSIIDVIECSGMVIAANDIACFKRLYHNNHIITDDPFEYYIQYYQEHFPCPTLLNTADRRFNVLQELIDTHKATGIIFIGEKFCEYEYFEFPFLEKKFKAKGIKTLILEIAADDDLNTEAFRTRIEAFSDLL